MESSDTNKKKKWIKPMVDILELKTTYGKPEQLTAVFEGEKTANRESTIGS